MNSLVIQHTEYHQISDIYLIYFILYYLISKTFQIHRIGGLYHQPKVLDMDHPLIRGYTYDTPVEIIRSEDGCDNKFMARWVYSH